MDANPQRAYRTEGNPQRCWGNGVGGWAEVIDRAWQQGAQHPRHLVSDGDGAIAAGIELVYDGEAPHQLCAFHLLRKYRRNIGTANYAGDCWGGALLV